MNYRHAYHAGNFADVVKHFILSRVILYMQRKDAAFRLLDTHAGTGLYDLASDAAQKTGEWQGGIGKLLDPGLQIPPSVLALISPYLDIVRDLNPDGQLHHYPGSPLLARKLMRKQDRLTALELHGDDFKLLQKQFAGDYQSRITELDGWLGLKSHLPPKEKRGIVLVDPPFEVFHEFFNILNGLKEAHKRFSSGTYLFWYPVKNRKACDEFRSELKRLNIPGILDCVLEVRRQTGQATFSGTGMIIVNPPYVLKQELETVLPYLTRVLETTPGSGSWSARWITPAL
ncbi:MAG: 23S rRNA (adenine(2030)-N(6))-methyltransferase RlmJ [Pseudomonadota bacterium]